MKQRHWQFFEVKVFEQGIGLLLLNAGRILLSGTRARIAETKVSSLSINVYERKSLLRWNLSTGNEIASMARNQATVEQKVGSPAWICSSARINKIKRQSNNKMFFFSGYTRNNIIASASCRKCSTHLYVRKSRPPILHVRDEEQTALQQIRFVRLLRSSF